MKPSRYWNIKENCLEEAKKYKYRSQLKKINGNKNISN